MKSCKWRIGTIMLALTILLGTTSIAFASPTPSPKNTEKDYYEVFVSKLATNLGIEKDKVTAALELTKKQLLQEAVKDGKLSQKQADQMAAKPGLHFFHHKKCRHGYMVQNIATVLGISTEQLKAELQKGKTLEEIITDHGMTKEQFKQKMLKLKSDKISQRVKAGEMTKAQADKILKRYEQRLKDKLFKEKY